MPFGTRIEGKATLTICGNCHLQTGYVFNNETSVTISQRGTIAIIKTDKDRVGKMTYHNGLSKFLNFQIFESSILDVSKTQTKCFIRLF